MMAKGSQWERKIAKRLSRWWTNGKRDDIFWRVRGSGGRATTRAKKGLNTYNQEGDIMATDPSGQPLIDRCVFELKVGYGKWCFLDEVDRAKGSKPLQYSQFYNQVHRDCEAFNKWPVLVCKRDYKKPMIILPVDLVNRIETFCGCLPEDEPQIILKFDPSMPMVCMRLEPFFTWCSPEFFTFEHSKRRDKTWKKALK